jgi:hypothetical protein
MFAIQCSPDLATAMGARQVTTGERKNPPDLATAMGARQGTAGGRPLTSLGRLVRLGTASMKASATEEFVNVRVLIYMVLS